MIVEALGYVSQHTRWNRAAGRFETPAEARARTHASLRAHLTYLQDRPGESLISAGGRRPLLTADADDVERAALLERLLAHDGPVGYHKLVLSPAAGERVPSWPAWTRTVLADLERHKHLSVPWAAAVHRNTAHPHVHTVLAGAGQTPSGRETPLRLTLLDLRYLSDRAAYHSEAALRPRLRTLERTRDRTQELERTLEAAR